MEKKEGRFALQGFRLLLPADSAPVYLLMAYPVTQGGRPIPGVRRLGKKLRLGYENGPGWKSGPAAVDLFESELFAAMFYSKATQSGEAEVFKDPRGKAWKAPPSTSQWAHPKEGVGLERPGVSSIEYNC